MSIKSFRDLDVWKAALDLATLTYRLTRQFPSDERFGLAAQMRRAATSVAANIAEGHARSGTREFLHFISITLGSLAELETENEIATRCELAPSELTAELLSSIAQVRMRLLALKVALSRRVHDVREDVPDYDAIGSCVGASRLPPDPCPALEPEVRAG